MAEIATKLSFHKTAVDDVTDFDCILKKVSRHVQMLKKFAVLVLANCLLMPILFDSFVGCYCVKYASIILGSYYMFEENSSCLKVMLCIPAEG